METAHSLFIIQMITYQYSHFFRHTLEEEAEAKPERARDEKKGKNKIRVMCLALYAFISIAHSVSLAPAAS